LLLTLLLLLILLLQLTQLLLLVQRSTKIFSYGKQSLKSSRFHGMTFFI